MRIASVLWSSRGMASREGQRAQVGRGVILIRQAANRTLAQSRLADDALIELTSHPRSSMPSCLVSARYGNAFAALLVFCSNTLLICDIGRVWLRWPAARLLLAQCFSLAQQRPSATVPARLLPSMLSILAPIKPPDPALLAQPSEPRRERLPLHAQQFPPVHTQSVACSPMALLP